MTEEVLEKFYRERLEERIISEFAKEKNLSLEDAMDIYYSSSLAEKINDGKNGIQYLDYRVLAEMLQTELSHNNLECASTISSDSCASNR